MENVPNFVSHNRGESAKYLLSELNKLGYTAHLGILDSAYFGVPQHRKRVYIVAFQEGHKGLFFSYTVKRTTPAPYRSIIVHGDSSIPISERWQEYIDLYTGKKALTEMSFKVPKTRTTLERVNQGVNLNDCILQLRSSGIRACSIDFPLPTFAVSHSGGGAMIPVYTGERRHMSLMEIKRLMGFPDAYVFPVARTHAIKQLSNAVCPPVIYSVAQDIQDHFLDQVDEELLITMR